MTNEMQLKKILEDDARELWSRLLSERFAHTKTAARLVKLLNKLTVRDATNLPSQRMCLLCRDVPVGVNPDRFRKECLHNMRAEADSEYARLSVTRDQLAADFAASRLMRTQTDAPQEESAPTTREF